MRRKLVDARVPSSCQVISVRTCGAEGPSAHTTKGESRMMACLFRGEQQRLSRCEVADGDALQDVCQRNLAYDRVLLHQPHEFFISSRCGDLRASYVETCSAGRKAKKDVSTPLQLRRRCHVAGPEMHVL